MRFTWLRSKVVYSRQCVFPLPLAKGPTSRTDIIRAKIRKQLGGAIYAFLRILSKTEACNNPCGHGADQDRSYFHTGLSQDTTQNPRPTPHEKPVTSPCRIRDPRLTVRIPHCTKNRALSCHCASERTVRKYPPVKGKAMTYTPDNRGMVSIEDACRILRTIFPNYPELKPCNPTPTLEPIAPSPVNTPVAA